MNTPLAVAAAAYLIFWITGRIAEGASPAPLGTGATFLLGAFCAGSAAVLGLMAGGIHEPGGVSVSPSGAALVAAVLAAVCLLSAAEKKLNILGGSSAARHDRTP